MRPTQAQLEQAAQTLRRSLGDYLDRNRSDGVFHLTSGGPGSVPALADLDWPELHLELLPDPMTSDQRAALVNLGYRPEASFWWHPDGWRLVLPGFGSGWAAQQRAMRAFLLQERGAAPRYRQVYLQGGRERADRALAPAAADHYARQVGWSPAHQVAGLLETLDSAWMFAAGTALDLHLGRVSRPHDDIDVVVGWDAQERLIACLESWRLDVPWQGQYRAWTGPLDAPLHQIHARHPDLPGVMMLDLLLTDLSGGRWHYRRDPRLTLPLERARRFSPDGLPYLAPELALLFKSVSGQGNPRSKDTQDFEQVRPTLSSQARDWLREALQALDPGHSWLAALGPQT